MTIQRLRCAKLQHYGLGLDFSTNLVAVVLDESSTGFQLARCCQLRIDSIVPEEMRPRARNSFKFIALAGIIIGFSGTTLSQLKIADRALSAIDVEFDGITEIGPSVGHRLIWDGSGISTLSTRKQSLPRPSFKTHPKFSEKLMDVFLSGSKTETDKRKRKQKQPRKQTKKTRRKDHKKTKPESHVKLKVPTPIFVPSLPKSGTTSTHQYFQCGGHKSAHLVAHSGEDTFKIGRCAQRNVREGRQPFAGCGDGIDVWTDTGMIQFSFCMFSLLAR